MNKKPGRVTTWAKLLKVSRPFITEDNREGLLISMNTHGMSDTKVITSWEEEYQEELRVYTENLKSNKNSIFLIGIGY